MSASRVHVVGHVGSGLRKSLPLLEPEIESRRTLPDRQKERPLRAGRMPWTGGRTEGERMQCLFNLTYFTSEVLP
jgi:hypothetical protein